MIRVRQADIAQRLGLTQQAVAYAFSSRPEYHRKLNTRTRRRILETARQLGYVPHRAARALSRGKTDLVLVTTRSALHHPHIHEFIEALNAALLPHGKEMLLELSAASESTERVVGTLAAGSADALVVLGYDQALLEELLVALPARLPKVAIGPGEPAGISTVEYDRVRATELAVTHLLEQGHRDVAMVFDLTTDLTAEERLRGYRQALEKAGRQVDPSLLFRASAHEPDGVALWQRLRARQPRPTGVFCYNDELALLLLQTIRAEGLRVPADVALVTLVDSRLTRLGEVPLSAVDVDYPNLARAAVEILVGKMQFPEAPVRHIRVQPRLVVRASSLGEIKETQ